MVRVAILAILSCLFFSTAASAMQRCTVGMMVTTPGGKVLEVVEIDGSGCRVYGTIDGILYDDWWAASQLEAADQGAIVSDDDHTLYAGTYNCYANGNYLYIDVIVATDGTYRDGTGAKGRLQSYQDGTVEFLSGPFKDYGGQALDGFLYIQQPGTQRQIQCSRH